MTTGTEGNDILTNDPAINPETVDALGGDDVITVNRPTQPFTIRQIQVNGGDGFDTLIINANNFTREGGAGGATGFDGSLGIREGSSSDWLVSWTSIERLEINGGRFFSSEINLGDEVDILRMTPGFGGRLTTAGGNDEIYFTGSGSNLPVTVEAGSGNDLIDLSGLAYFGTSPPPPEGGLPAHRAFGGDGNDIIRGTAYRDYLDGGDGNDTIYAYLSIPGSEDATALDRIFGGSGNDNFFLGANLSQFDVVQGGEGVDTLVVQGNYAGGLTLSANVTQIENLSILGGNNVTLGEPGSNRFDYAITTIDANFAAGVQARINGAALLAGEDFTFNGSAETDASFVVYGGKGVDTLTGGFGNDIFIYAEERFAAGDTVNGGPGGYDGIFLRGNYTIDFNAPGYFGLMNSIENMTLTSITDERYARGGDPAGFDYNITLADNMLLAGVELTVSGSLLTASETMILDASQESDGTLRIFGGKANDVLKGGGQADVIYGNLGADMLTGNGGADVFRYDSVAESKNSSLDHILDFTPGTDRIDLSRIDASTQAPGDQAFTWIGSNAFSGAAGELRIDNLNGMGWFLMGDSDGNGTADFVVMLTLQGPNPLSAGDFIL